jgi:pyruvate/2-oxoglutarate dehydrogenase complex dihydrolipoamide dehydrogenase (E3) component
MTLKTERAMRVRILMLVLPIALTVAGWTAAALEAQNRPETIAIIGTGNVGSTLGKIWAARGHTIIYGA